MIVIKNRSFRPGFLVCYGCLTDSGSGLFTFPSSFFQKDQQARRTGHHQGQPQLKVAVISCLCAVCAKHLRCPVRAKYIRRVRRCRRCRRRRRCIRRGRRCRRRRRRRRCRKCVGKCRNCSRCTDAARFSCHRDSVARSCIFLNRVADADRQAGSQLRFAVL